jgi:hypothetical protein
MNMPGFTAESSLYKRVGSKIAARDGARGETRIAIAPQALQSLCREEVVASDCNPCVNGKQECFKLTRWCCWRGIPFHPTCGAVNWVDLGSWPC